MAQALAKGVNAPLFAVVNDESGCSRFVERIALESGYQVPAKGVAAPLIAVIDDQSEFCRFVERIALESGYQVFATNDPHRFMAEIGALDPALLILDLNIPRLDGVELLRELATIGVSCKVLVVSGADIKVIESALLLGEARGMRMEGFLQKPLCADELRRSLERLNPTLQVNPTSQEATQNDLRMAIEQNGLSLQYQPLLDLRTNQIVGAEALARWQHATLGPISPAKFIPFAERHGLITPLMRWVIVQAVKQAADWRARGFEIGTSINLSPAATLSYDVPDWVERICARANLPTHCVTFELTETAAMRDAVTLMEVLTRFRLKGFHLAIDDFGTGYSSLVQLRRLPFSELKIDIEFVRNLLTSESSRVIVDTIIGMARNLKLATVAEGVENVEVMEMLREKGCDFVQGFQISRPLDADDFVRLLEARSSNAA